MQPNSSKVNIALLYDPFNHPAPEIWRVLLGVLLLNLLLRSGIPVAAASEVSPTTRAIAAKWLDRAQRDIEALPAETSHDLPFLQPRTLAIELCRIGPDDERRALAIKLIDQSMKANAPQAKSAAQVRICTNAGALEHALVDDMPGARRLLAALDAPMGAGPTSEPIGQIKVDAIESLRLETYLLLDDRAAFERAKPGQLELSVTVESLVSIGRLDDARWVADLEYKRATAEVDESAGRFSTPALDRLGAVRDLARCGMTTEAFKAAATVEPALPENQHVRAEDYRFQAYVGIAQAVLDTGDIDSYKLARTAAIELFKNQPKEIADNVLNLLGLCVRAKDREGFNDAATHFHAWIGQNQSADGHDPISDARWLAKLAGLYAAIGDQAEYQTAAKQAEQALSVLDNGKDVTEKQKIDHAKQRAQDYLQIAAAFARAGDVAGVQRNVAAAKQTAKLDDEEWDGVWWYVCHAYADAALFDQAVAAVTDAREDIYGLKLGYVARREAEAGRFNDAWKLAARTPGVEHVSLEYFLAIREVQAGHQSNLDVRINALKTPNERALLELATAQALLGRTFQGEFRIFRPRDE